MPPGGPPGGRKAPVKLILIGALALVLIIGVALSAFLYLTGRLGFGPLSAKDQEAVAVIADGVDGPAWATASDIECGADHLLHDQRSAELSTTGLIEEDGDGWDYDPSEWDEDTATTFYEGVLDCTDDWAGAVGEVWELDDADCLGGIGTTTMATYFAGETLIGLENEDGDVATDADETAATMRADAVADLDDCYVVEAPEPQAKAKPAYRSVRFTFSEIGAEGADFEVTVKDGSEWSELPGATYRLDTGEGGVEGCVDARVSASYPWGTVSEAESEFCGKAKKKEFFWRKLRQCKSEEQRPCQSYELRFAGYRTGEVLTATYTHNGGDCLAASGSCTATQFVQVSGRGMIQTWSFPLDYNGRFVATLEDGTTAVLPN